MTDDTPSTGLQELLARRFLTTDGARPEKVDAWHARGRRTARENITDLVDQDSFVEYGRFITPAQEQRRHVAELVVEAPADGLVAGTARVPLRAPAGTAGSRRSVVRWAARRPPRVRSACRTVGTVGPSGCARSCPARAHPRRSPSARTSTPPTAP